MTTDGGLRALFRKHVKRCFWQSIETASIAAGVPDSFYCFNATNGEAAQGWIEHKQAVGKNCYVMQPGQLPWAKQYRYYGGAYFLAVRRQKGELDQLWILGLEEIIKDHVVRAKGQVFGRLLPHHLHFDGGPAKWNWSVVTRVMQMRADEFAFLSFDDRVKSSSPPVATGNSKMEM